MSLRGNAESECPRRPCVNPLNVNPTPSLINSVQGLAKVQKIELGLVTPSPLFFPSLLSPQCQCPFLSLGLSSWVRFRPSPSRHFTNLTCLLSATTNLLALIVLCLSAYTYSQTASYLGVYFPYSALGIATAVIHIASVSAV